MRTTGLFLLLCVGVEVERNLSAQKLPVDQWPNYQNNSGLSPLTQITPQNVATLSTAWTFNYGAGSAPSVPFVGLDYRFQVEPPIIGGVMYISTPSSETNPNLQSTITALKPETGKVLWQYKSPLHIHGRGIAYWNGNGTVGPRLYFASDKGYLMALDIKTHELAQDFGSRG